MENKEVAKQDPQQALKDNTSKKFEALKTQAIALSDQCKSIKVEDAITLSMAEQTLSKSNQLYKMIEDKRVAIKAPYIAAGKTIDKIANEMLDPLEEAIKKGKDIIKQWNDKQAQIKKEADEKNSKIVSKINALHLQLQEKTELCTTPDKCQNLIDSINKVFPKKESFLQYADDAELIKTNYLQLLKIRKATQEASLAGNINVVAQGMKMVHNIESANKTSAVAIQEKSEMISSATTITKSATKKTYKFEIVDENLVDRKLMSVDDKKVRDHMATIKDKITTDGITIDGIKYYIDNTVTIR